MFLKILGVLLLTFAIQANELEKYDYILLIQLYNPPVNELEWELSVFRIGNEFWIQSKGFRNRNWKRLLPKDKYISFVKEVNRAGLWSLHNADNIVSGAPYYIVRMSKRNDNRVLKFSAVPPFRGKLKNMGLIVRTIKNYAVIMTPDS